MSTPKTCDRDGGNFNTNAVGWASGVFKIHRKYADGSRYEETVSLDFCPQCVEDMTGVPRVPMVMLPGETRDDLPKQGNM
jgi:hypothetical protein